MDKRSVNKNVNKTDKKKNGGWKEALADAEQGIEKATKELADWKAVAAICRKRIAQNAKWPNSAQLRDRELGQQHSV